MVCSISKLSKFGPGLGSPSQSTARFTLVTTVNGWLMKNVGSAVYPLHLTTYLRVLLDPRVDRIVEAETARKLGERCRSFLPVRTGFSCILVLLRCCLVVSNKTKTLYSFVKPCS
jgi:hypothetical protein